MQTQRFRRRWISSCSVLCRRFLFLYKNTCRKVLPDLLLLFETTPCFFMDSEKLWFVEVVLQTRCILESFLELLPNVRNSCFLMRSSYHRPICMSTDNMCIFYTSVPFTNLKCNICTVLRNHFLLLVTQKFQFYTIYAIFLIMWYIKCVFEIHIVLPMTYDYRAGLWESQHGTTRRYQNQRPRNVKTPELFMLRRFLIS